MNDQTKKDVATRPAAPSISFDHQVRLAESFANSGLFGVKTVDQALALMALCEAEGIHPANAIREYDIVDGRPSLRADAMLARFQNAGGRVRWLEMTDERVVGEFSHPAGGTVTIDWDMKRAKQAGLEKKRNWQHYPRPMLRSRVASEGVRAVYPGVVVGVYTPEEVQDFDEPPAPPRDVTPEEPPQYSEEGFEAKLPVWRDLIHEDGKTPEAIIAKVSSRYTLTDEQKQKIRSLADSGDSGSDENNDPATFFGEHYDEDA